MFGIGRQQKRGVFSARTGLISAAVLGASLLARKLWKKKEAGSFGLREAYPKSSEWTPETTTP